MSVKFYPNYIFVAGFDAAAEPSITGETYACSGGETTGPAYDLIDNRSTRVVTIDTNGQTTAPVIDFDLLANIASINFVIIDNSNFNTANSDVGFSNKGSTLDISSAYQGVRGSAMTACSIAGGTVADTSDDGSDGIILFVPETITDNGFEVNLIYDTVFAADITIGEIAIGVSCITTYSANARPLESYQYQGVDITQSLGGQKYATKRFGAQRAWRLTWDLITDTDKTNLEAMFDVVDGQTYPLWVDFGDAATPKLHFVRFMQDRLDFQKQTHGVYTLTIDLQEEL